MINPVNIRRHWRSCFEAVYSQYKEFQSVIGTSSSEQFYKALSKAENKGSHNPNEVLPTTIDFVADVELAAKSALHPIEFALFEKVFIKGPGEYSQVAYRDIREKLGKVFLARRLYPTFQYFFTQVGQAKRRCSCGSKEHDVVETSTALCAGGCGLNTLFHPVGMVDTFNRVGGSMAFWCEECTRADEARLDKEIYERRQPKAA